MEPATARPTGSLSAAPRAARARIGTSSFAYPPNSSRCCPWRRTGASDFWRTHSHEIAAPISPHYRRLARCLLPTQNSGSRLCPRRGTAVRGGARGISWLRWSCPFIGRMEEVRPALCRCPLSSAPGCASPVARPLTPKSINTGKRRKSAALGLLRRGGSQAQTSEVEAKSQASLVSGPDHPAAQAGRRRKGAGKHRGTDDYDSGGLEPAPGRGARNLKNGQTPVCGETPQPLWWFMESTETD